MLVFDWLYFVLKCKKLGHLIRRGKRQKNWPIVNLFVVNTRVWYYSLIELLEEVLFHERLLLTVAVVSSWSSTEQKSREWCEILERELGEMWSQRQQCPADPAGPQVPLTASSYHPLLFSRVVGIEAARWGFAVAHSRLLGGLEESWMRRREWGVVGSDQLVECYGQRLHWRDRVLPQYLGLLRA